VPSDSKVSIYIPGLAEKRHNLIIGDKVLVKHHNLVKQNWWEGYVHGLSLESAELRFNDKFRPFKSQIFDIRFCLDRLPIRRMHHGLDAGNKDIIPRLLFPRPQDINRAPSKTMIDKINPANREIGHSVPQKLAVTAIRSLRPGSAPFIIIGP
jgi:helicase MOV-10